MVNGKPATFTVKHYFNPKFRDVADSDSACVGPNQIDEIELLSDGPDPYRSAAIAYVRSLVIIDSFMTATEDARLAWVGISIALRLTSVRGLTHDRDRWTAWLQRGSGERCYG
jgi:hypothetical protein